MSFWFFFCIVGIIINLPFLFLSYEHKRFREKFGREKGDKIARALGLITGYLYFGFWAGLWFAPQDSFTLNILPKLEMHVFDWFMIPLDHFLVGLAFLVPGAWLGIRGVQEITLRVAEFHMPKRVVMTGPYAKVRHPQYLGGILSHVGMTVLFSALWSLYLTPLIIIINYLIARKEEIELLREFGEVYRDYMRKVPMFVPHLKLYGSKSPDIISD